MRTSPTQSAVISKILKQETSRSAAHNMKWHPALIEPSRFDWSEAKLGNECRNRRAGMNVIAGQEYGLPLRY